jgi:hypothetical protein
LIKWSDFDDSGGCWIALQIVWRREKIPLEESGVNQFENTARNKEKSGISQAN